MDSNQNNLPQNNQNNSPDLTLITKEKKRIRLVLKYASFQA
ncbi:hypothetical protein L289_2076 [Acinetobacter gerneri DSM 14967 = CIP 107464 = MTCC 9824]|uniref:Uncharacterized protein n=1 Tax=Acinetobacter gerneri DSM 14967 = CIP 107464 = MTCC 9824 TaxID=1120926 RepID=N8ZE36_9GAMM|nr:hypothetical protein F960_03374 [Acinetobacter gerneri DSM 14967 = CIP 107464 = MTCC 9824]EPR83707.1 hypothetical protein L289_2076 [Acinetobacter gerneri DSM 14967 = CIP 107464 = MTCC 9824]